jgi:hypothetical protein
VGATRLVVLILLAMILLIPLSWVARASKIEVELSMSRVDEMSLGSASFL